MTRHDKSSSRDVTKSLLRDYASRRLCSQGGPGAHGSACRDDDAPDAVPDIAAEEAEFLADPLDPRAAFSPARARRWLESIRHDRDAEQVWTVNEVKWRLEEAVRIGERVICRDGPSLSLGFWPDPNIFGNVDDFDKNCRYEGARDGSREADDLARDVARSASEVEVSRFEQAIVWPLHYLGAERFERERLTLQSWMKSLAFRQPWKRWMVEPESASRRLRGNAFVVITCGLIRDKARVV